MGRAPLRSIIVATSTMPSWSRFATRPSRFGTLPLIVYGTFFSRASTIHDAYSHDRLAGTDSSPASIRSRWASAFTRHCGQLRE